LTINLKYVGLITLGLFIWLSGIVLAPLLVSSGIPGMVKLGYWDYFFFDPVCHQISSRSFLLNGFPMAVCVRCFSVYLAGFFICLVLFRQRLIRLLPMPFYLLLVVPAAGDFTLEKIIQYPGLPWLRFVTGFLMGVALFHLIFVSTISGEIKTGKFKAENPMADQ